jgi:hypothetical protein
VKEVVFLDTVYRRSLLFTRDYELGRGYEGDVVIHGHEPTPNYGHYFSLARSDKNLGPQFNEYKTESLLPFLFSRYPVARCLPMEAGQAQKALEGIGAASLLDLKAAPFCYATDNINGVEAINIDTGAVIGGALTAIGLSEKYLRHGWLIFFSCPTSGDNSRPENKLVKMLIKATAFGGRSRPRRPRPWEDDDDLD